MKKHAEKMMAMVMTGILLLTGCGGKTDTLAPVETEGISRQEEPAAEPAEEDAVSNNAENALTGEENLSGRVSEMTDMPENGTDDTEVEKPADSTAESCTKLAEASESGGAEEKKARFDNAENSLLDSYDESSDLAAEEWKMADESVADLYARGEADTDGYLGSCYDFPGEETYGQKNQEEYSEWEEQGFFSVMTQPLSTFSADVDTASYSNLRRLLREGYTLESLPEGAVRIEEMLNYFSYDYKEPEGQEPFGVTTEIGRCPWNKEAELLMVGLKTEDIGYDQAPASNLVFLLDVSGSMDEPDKLPLLQESFAQLTDRLTEKDRISIVTYASEDRVVLEGASGNEKRKIKKAINGLEAGGGTWGSRGIETAYALAEENFIKGGNNRVILATDGDLNIGMTSEEELEELISEKKKSGVFLSVLGFGTDNIKDNKMEILADKGNGNYAYIDCIQEARKVLFEEMTATLLTICKDVKFQVEFNSDVVEAYRLLGYDNRALDRKDFNDDTKDGGEIGAGHSVTALYEIVLREPVNDGMTEREIKDLKYGSAYRRKLKETSTTPVDCGKEWLTISVRYKRPSGSRSELLEYPVGYECYQAKPSNDFLFAAAVAEFGLLASHSAYPEDASVENVRKTVKKLDLKDDYKIEFLELVEEASFREELE